MNVALLFPALPPVLDGIGDHTARLAEALARAGHDVRVLTAQVDADPVPGAEVRCVLDAARPSDFRGLFDAVDANVPDVLVVQYNPFSWGRYGFNVALPERLRQLKRRHPAMTLAVMMHEPFVPVTDWKFAVMTTWQRWQLWRLGHIADVFFCSIEPWAERFSQWFPRTPVLHLPIGCNIPVTTLDRDAVRSRFGFEDRLVVGLFGSALRYVPDCVTAAAEAISEKDESALVVYVGTKGGAVQDAWEGAVDLGPLPAPDVSAVFQSMDLYLTPYPDGASTRRGTLMAGLAHGVPTLTTEGPNTDAALSRAAPSALRMAPVGDAGAFARAAVDLIGESGVGEGGCALYARMFDWPVVAERLASTVRRERGL